MKFAVPPESLWIDWYGMDFEFRYLRRASSVVSAILGVL